MPDKTDVRAVDKLVRILSMCTPYITLDKLPEHHPTLAKVMEEMQITATKEEGLVAQWGFADNAIRLRLDPSGSGCIERTLGSSTRTIYLLFEDTDAGASTRLALLLVGMYEHNAWGDPVLS